MQWTSHTSCVGHEPTTSGTRRALVVAFALLGLGAVASSAVALAAAWAIERHASFIVRDAMMRSIVVGRISVDVTDEQVLVMRHIFASEAAEMAGLEGQRARVLADLHENMDAYDRWPISLHERAQWEHVRADIGQLDDLVDRAIELSRANRDAEAQAVMKNEAWGRREVLGRDLDEMMAMSDRAALDSLRKIYALRSELLFVLLGLGMATLIGVVLIGRWSLQQVRRREEQARLQSRMLEERNRDLDAFAGRVAHDIRGPLTTVSLVTARLSQTAPGEQKAVETLRRGIDRMEALIRDLLALARVEKMHEACDPASASANIEEQFAQRIEAEKGTLRVSLDHSRIRCSDGLLLQVLANLVDNALKYRRTEVPPKIAVSGSPVGATYEIQVVDNGVGMAPEDAAQLFLPFYRAARTRDLPGTGLGLSIVKRVVEASGGSIAVDTHLGQGTSFVVRFPVTETTDHDADA